MEWFKTTTKNGRQYVYDPIRQRFVVLTPEEKVRQGTLKYLVEQATVPSGLIAVEYSIKVNRMDKRCDIVVFDQKGAPRVIVECKAASVTINETTLEQAIRYYTALKPKYLMLTNGDKTYFFLVKTDGLEAQEKLPSYEEMTKKD